MVFGPVGGRAPVGGPGPWCTIISGVEGASSITIIMGHVVDGRKSNIAP